MPAGRTRRSHTLAARQTRHSVSSSRPACPLPPDTRAPECIPLSHPSRYGWAWQRGGISVPPTDGMPGYWVVTACQQRPFQTHRTKIGCDAWEGRSQGSSGRSHPNSHHMTTYTGFASSSNSRWHGPFTNPTHGRLERPPRPFSERSGRVLPPPPRIPFCQPTEDAMCRIGPNIFQQTNKQ